MAHILIRIFSFQKNIGSYVERVSAGGGGWSKTVQSEAPIPLGGGMEYAYPFGVALGSVAG